MSHQSPNKSGIIGLIMSILDIRRIPCCNNKIINTSRPKIQIVFSILKHVAKKRVKLDNVKLDWAFKLFRDQ